MDEVRITIRRILLILLVIWMIAVFMLSHQTGEASGNLSRMVANFLTGGDTVKAEHLEPIVRKVAHMTEYAIGGMLFFGITLTFPNNSLRKNIILSLLFIILYAISDELHQTFINNRSGNVKDVFIDTCGGALGILAVFFIQLSILAMDKRIQDDLKNK